MQGAAAASSNGCRCAIPAWQSWSGSTGTGSPANNPTRSRLRSRCRIEEARFSDGGPTLMHDTAASRKRIRLHTDAPGRGRRDFSIANLFPTPSSSSSKAHVHTPESIPRRTEPGTVASLTTADKSSEVSRPDPSPPHESPPKLPHAEETSVHDLTEELVGVPTTNSGTADEINTLLAYPTLYDPIRKPRNPVVLCHGLYGFDTWGLEMLPALRIHYWADVLAVLKGVVGIDPIITGVPGTGHITERAKKLHETLCKEVKGKDINLVAHSMGGLDGRYLLSHIKPTEYNPLSLTTLATPHRGSQFMSWCRANIGIGDIAKAAAEASDKSSGSSKSTVEGLLDDGKLPYSLGRPLLTRKQQEERDAAEGKQEKTESTTAGDKMAEKAGASTSREEKKAALQKSGINLPGLNYSLGTSLASYLLDLLDSPAYGCLTPEYLNSTFNPSTPDRPDVKYFSVAARAQKLSVAHPLWLPKLILDKAEELEKHKDQQKGRTRPDDWQWGNDGLVPIYSAKWGEYLGCMDNTDHWSLRGGSGLSTDFSVKKLGITASKQAEVATDKAKEMASSVIPDSVEETASSISSSISNNLPDKPTFGWRDVNQLIGRSIADRDGPASPSNPSLDSSNNKQKDSKVSSSSLWPFASAAEPSAEQDTKKLASQATSNSTKESLSGLAGIANWIVKRIPLPLGKDQKLLTSSIVPSFPFDDILDGSSSQISEKPKQGKSSSSTRERSVSDTARLLFGSSPSSSAATKPSSPSSSSSGKNSKKFNHERFYVALCKKLYDEGL